MQVVLQWQQSNLDKYSRIFIADLYKCLAKKQILYLLLIHLVPQEQVVITRLEFERRQRAEKCARMCRIKQKVANCVQVRQITIFGP